MKRLILLALLVVSGMGAQAQIVSSKSNLVYVEKKTHSSLTFYVKAGIGVDAFRRENYHNTGYVVDDSGFGYELDFGLRGFIGNQGAFWGAEIGGMSAIEAKYNYNGNPTAEGDIAGQVNPYFGWDFSLGGNVSLAPFVGPYASYCFKASEGYIGVSIGINFWFSGKYAVGVNYRRSIVDLEDDDTAFQKILLTGIIGF